MKILILFGLWASLNVVIMWFFRGAGAKQRAVDKKERAEAESEYAEFLRNYKSFDHAAKEATWRVR